MNLPQNPSMDCALVAVVALATVEAIARGLVIVGVLEMLEDKYTKTGRHDSNPVVSAFEMNRRVIAFDVVRGIACLMVLGIHLLQLCVAKTDCSMPRNIMYFFMTPCDGLFFMVTGCLLLRDSELSLNFFIHRVVGIYVPVTIVSLLIVIFSFGSTIGQQHENIISFLGKPVWPSYWFFYTLFGVYLLSVPMNNLYRRFKIRFLNYAIMAWLIEIGLLLGLVMTATGVTLLDIMCEYPILLSILFWGFFPLGKYIYLKVEEPCMLKMMIMAVSVLLLSIVGTIACITSSMLQEYLFQNYLSPISVCFTACVFYSFLKCRLNSLPMRCVEFLGRHSLWFCLLHVLPWALKGVKS